MYIERKMMELEAGSIANLEASVYPLDIFRENKHNGDIKEIDEI